MTKTRLTLDLGTTSLGWALLETTDTGEPLSLIKSGVRIFNNGRDDKSNESLNKKRQEARSARRRNDRIKQRKNALLKYLVQLGFMPTDKQERQDLELLDPLDLRTQAITTKLHPHHIGRAIFHLSQRRGFLSNRKSDKSSNESGVIKQAIARTEQELFATGHKTIGTYLNALKQDGKGTKARPDGKDYTLYLHRSMLKQEFDIIWNEQKKYNTDLYTDESYAIIENIIFYQRPLKSQKENVGLCSVLYADGEKRCPKALPTFQNFRILQDLSNLAWIDNRGNDYPIKKYPKIFFEIYDTLTSGKNLSFKAMRTTLIKAGHIPANQGEILFNFESETRKNFVGAETAYMLSAKKGSPLQGIWETWDSQKQDDFIEILLDDQTTDAEVLKTLTEQYGLENETAIQCMESLLPESYGNLSKKIISEILPIMQEQGLRYDQALQELGYHHSQIDKKDGVLPLLPYYAEHLQEHVTGGTGINDENGNKNAVEQNFGKIANPTVHIGLRQVESVVNDIIRRFGKPDFATVELARDLSNSKKQKDKYSKIQKENKENNDKYAKLLAENNVPNNSRNRLILRLWHELDKENANNRRCPYTGEQIGLPKALSSDVEIEHILPYSVTLDDSPANKTLSIRKANRDKGDKSPFEAFGHNPSGYDWAEIVTRAQKLPRNKARRFSENAIENYKSTGGVAERQLNDTRYLSKIVRKYLTLIIAENNIHVVAGQLTAKFRRKWGLDEILYKKADLQEKENLIEKNRNDHRHHAIDAIVIGCITRGMLQKVCTVASRNKEKMDKLLADMPYPWDTFRHDTQTSINEIIISHKADRAKQGQLHEDTFYGLVDVINDKKGNPTKKAIYQVRKDIIALVPMPQDYKIQKALKNIEQIKDPLIKEQILEYIGTKKSRNEIIQVLEKFIKDTGIRRVRTLLEKENLIPIKKRHLTEKEHGEHRYYVLGGNNWGVEIFENVKGKWQGEVISIFDANQKEFIPQWRKDNPAKKMIMRLHKNDLVELIKEGDSKIYRIATIGGSGQITVKEHNISQNSDSAIKSFTGSSIQQYNPRKIHISPSGMIMYDK